MSVHFFTDFCCDLPPAYATRRGLTIVPMAYKIGDREITCHDEAVLSMKSFYKQMREGAMSSTSQVSTFTFIELFRPLFERGDDVFYIAFSSALSGTYQSAVLAREQLLAEFPERKFYVIDSLNASTGQGLYIHYALNMRDEGKTPDEILVWLEEHKQNFAAWFTVSDLDFLRRGGRVSAAAAFVGTMLNIKPVLHVDREGALIAMEKVKGRPRSLRALVDHMEKTAINPAEQTVFIGHGDNQEDAQIVADMIKERFGTKDFLIHHIGPIVGAHSGPDTIALFFYAVNRD